MNKPLLIVVTGRPGSGKTTLAHALANAVHCPAFCRDEFKEGFVNTHNTTHDALGNDANRHVYETFFPSGRVGGFQRHSLIIEAAFQHALWVPKLEPLQELSRMSLVICTVDPGTARARFLQRRQADPARVRFHGDRAAQAAPEEVPALVANYNPPRLSAPTLPVDTTDGYRPGMDAIVAFVTRA